MKLIRRCRQLYRGVCESRTQASRLTGKHKDGHRARLLCFRPEFEVALVSTKHNSPPVPGTRAPFQSVLVSPEPRSHLPRTCLSTRSCYSPSWHAACALPSLPQPPSLRMSSSPAAAITVSPTLASCKSSPNKPPSTLVPRRSLAPPLDRSMDPCMFLAIRPLS